jgi:hypothetical protein
MSSAARELRRRDVPVRSGWNLMRVFRLVAVAAGIVVVAGFAVRWFGSQPAEIAVNLVATRANGAESIAPAGAPLRLHPDLTGLAPGPLYRMEVVDRNGARVWRGELIPPQESVAVARQGAGTYFVRIFTASGDLLREYGLEIR